MRFPWLAIGFAPQADFFQQCYNATINISTQQLLEQGFSGKELGEALDKQRISAITQIKQTQ